MRFRLHDKLTAYCPAVPTFLHKRTIRNAKSLMAEDESATIFLQEIKREDFIITLAMFTIRKATVIHPVVQEPTLALHYMLNGGPITCTLAGAGQIVLTSGRGHLFYLPAGTQTAFFQEGFYVTFYIELSASYLSRIRQEHVSVQRIMDRLGTASEIGEMLSPATIDYDFDIVKDDILYSTKSGAALDLLLEAGILRLLAMYEHQLNISGADLTENIVHHAIAQIKLQVLERSEDRLTIREIARQHRVSVRKLERDFKQHTGMTMLEFYIKEKMRKAVQMVCRTSQPIKSVAANLGYLDVSAFIRVFKRIYGMSPTAVRENPGLIDM